MPDSQEQLADLGGGGELFARKDNLRSDSRLAAKMISLGCVPVEKAEELLRKGLELAGACADAGRAREYAACMKIAIEAVKLEQKERELDKPANQVNVQLNVGEIRRELIENDEQYIEYQRQRALDVDTGLICQDGEQRGVEDGQAPRSTRQGASGDREGGE